LNTQTSSYITAPSSLSSPPTTSSLSRSQLLDLTAGINPIGNSGDARVYGGVPGNPADAHTQWVIVPNSDNSIRYSFLSLLLFCLVFSFARFWWRVKLEMLNLRVGSFSSKAYPSKVLDLAAGIPTDGTLILLWEKNGGLNQEWRLMSRLFWCLIGIALGI